MDYSGLDCGFIRIYLMISFMTIVIHSYVDIFLSRFSGHFYNLSLFIPTLSGKLFTCRNNLALLRDCELQVEGAGHHVPIGDPMFHGELVITGST
jgi:hypothetical protein